MLEVEVQAKKWGNSLGVILPKKVVAAQHLKDGANLQIIIKPKRGVTVGEIIAAAKKHPLFPTRKMTQQVLDEIDRELWSEEK